VAGVFTDADPYRFAAEDVCSGQSAAVRHQIARSNIAQPSVIEPIERCAIRVGVPSGQVAKALSPF